MPKSKRDKKITLTKTSKKGLVLKQQIVEDIRKCASKYQNIFLFSVQNMRNSKLKDVRGEWKDSRFFFGKNKIMALGLGKSPEDEVQDGLHKLSAALKGQRGLLFTDRAKDEVLEWMEKYGEEDYARSGFVATETIELTEGPLPDFSHSIEPHLRKLGLPTSLQKGVVTLLNNHVVCKKGKTLTPEQARILKLFGRALATFKLTPLGYWIKNEGYTEIAKETDENDGGNDESEEGEMETEDNTDT